MKLEVSDQTYNELSVLLKRKGREINDGMPLQIEKGDAIMPPHDFRMVAIRQNCLMAAAEVYKDGSGDRSITKISQEIFEWVLNGTDPSKPQS